MRQDKIIVGSGGCFCRVENRRKGLKPKTSPFLCECGFKVRGRNHAEGSHHNHTVAKHRRGRW